MEAELEKSVGMCGRGTSPTLEGVKKGYQYK